MGSLDGKVAFITGVARGQGRSHAVRLAADGASILSYLQETAAELRSKGARVQTYALDLTNTSRLVGLREEIHRQGGPIDVLVNNAGVVFGGAFLDVPLERHMTTYRVNTLGLVAMTHVNGRLIGRLNKVAR